MSKYNKMSYQFPLLLNSGYLVLLMQIEHIDTCTSSTLIHVHQTRKKKKIWRTSNLIYDKKSISMAKHFIFTPEISKMLQVIW